MKLTRPTPLPTPSPKPPETEHVIRIQIAVPVFGVPGDRHDMIAAARIMEMVKCSVDSRSEGVLLGDPRGLPQPGMRSIPTMNQLIGKDPL